MKKKFLIALIVIFFLAVLFTLGSPITIYKEYIYKEYRMMPLTGCFDYCEGIKIELSCENPYANSTECTYLCIGLHYNNCGMKPIIEWLLKF